MIENYNGLQPWSKSWHSPWHIVVIGKPGGSFRQFAQNPNGRKSPFFAMDDDSTDALYRWLENATGNKKPKGF